MTMVSNSSGRSPRETGVGGAEGGMTVSSILRTVILGAGVECVEQCCMSNAGGGWWAG